MTSRDFWTPVRIALALLAVLTLVFVFENTQSTRVRLIGPVLHMPLWAALFATGVVGALCGAFLTRYRRRR
ncbi:hypothetical protein D7294_31050 [Streptomyces hoynatensis]|uniref:LapA family protein n=1 Tax=Streptomyces hoynatensis TaxID=1141874 RepID=A0A3A9YD47_9ACTN|nr:hypothetical protein D7294_31050 [Streptomyces hoynatensis]